MVELFEKSIRTLELPRILDMLADCARTDEGRDKALALRPMTEADDVKRALEETSAAVAMLFKHGTPSFTGVKPVATSLHRADMGGCLNTRELLSIAVVLRASRTAKDYGDSGENTPISHLFRCLVPNRLLEESITGSIIGEDEIADSASSELASIRRHMRATEAKVRSVLQDLLGSDQSKYLQESIITIRSERYVVPVKSEHKNMVSGLVHDVSSSGSTFFIEPMGVVKANNELRELLAQEKKEIERILAALSAECATYRESIEENYTLLIWLDGIFARGALSLKMEATEPKISDRYLHVRGARHPLLDIKTAVRNDIQLGEHFDTLMITGPNTGGKTVTLKTIGLLTLMAQCGLHIPCKSDSTVKIFSRVLADVGDEQSISQSLSTFSSHMTNIVKILEVADSDTLILLDELGAGTDPVEGAAIAAAIIDSARRMGAMIAATTHYAELKVYAMTTDGVENASCEFNVDTLAPTYRLVMGIPGKSNAFAISRRLGLPDYIIEKAGERLDAENVRFEDVLTRLDHQRQEMEREREESRRLKLELEDTVKTTNAYRQKLEAERLQVMEKAQLEVRSIIQEARDASDLVMAEMKDMRKKQSKEQDWQEVNQRRVEARTLLNDTERALGGSYQVEQPPSTRPAVQGDTVELVAMGTRANVVSVNKDGSLRLQAGILSITAKQDEVRVCEGETAGQKSARKIVQKAHRTLSLKATASEVDLRGMERIEAVIVLEQFLDAALMGKLETVCIIHGKGTGAVRQAVRDYCKKSRYIKTFRPGRYGEGEDGVTVAELK